MNTSLDPYYRRRLTYQPVTQEEEARLLRRIATKRPGWVEARDRVFSAYAPLALSIARRAYAPFASHMRGAGYAEEDFIAAANSGLLRAIELFKVRDATGRRGFPSYARQFIRGAVYAILRREGSRGKTVSLEAIRIDRKRRSPSEEDESSVDSLPGLHIDPWDAIQQAEVFERMTNLFSQLPVSPEDKAFILLLLKCRMNLAAVARRSGYSREQARVKWKKIRGRLRAALAKELGVVPSQVFSTVCS